MVSSAYLRLLILSWQFWFQLVLHTLQHFTWCILHIMLNMQCDNMLSWRTNFHILNQSIIPCLVLTVASWPAYRFLRKQVRWSGIPISWRIFHSLLWSPQFVVILTVKGFSVVNEADVDVSLEFSCFFWDPMDFVNLIWVSLSFLNAAYTSGSSWFTCCWSLSWRTLSITLLACEKSATVRYFEHSLILSFFGIGRKTDFFCSMATGWGFQICWHIECSTSTA